MCPVGAVSNTILVNFAYFSSLVNCTTFAMAIASSSPGGGVSNNSPNFKSCNESEMPLKPTLPIKSLAPLVKSALFENSENSLFACVVSISIAQSIPSVPSTATGTPEETSCASESLKECAGSVETISVGCWPDVANFTANDADNDVFPTPPFPPTR